jgi:hypothetical protein
MEFKGAQPKLAVKEKKTKFKKPTKFKKIRKWQPNEWEGEYEKILLNLVWVSPIQT